MTLFDLMVTARGQAFDRWLVRYTGHSLLNRIFARQAGIRAQPALLLETKGRKTGIIRSAALPYFSIDGHLLVVGSRGGAPLDPGWAINLRHDKRAVVYLKRQPYIVQAQFLEGEEYQQYWQQITSIVPTYAQYQSQTSRRIPLIVLEP